MSIEPAQDYQSYYEGKWNLLESSIDSVARLIDNLNSTFGEFMDRRASTPFSYRDMERATEALNNGAQVLSQLISWRSTHTSESFLKDPKQAASSVRSIEKMARQSYDAMIPQLQKLAEKQSEFGGYIRAKVETLRGEFTNLFNSVKGVQKALTAFGEMSSPEPEVEAPDEPEVVPKDDPRAHPGKNPSIIPTERQLDPSFEEKYEDPYKYECPDCGIPFMSLEDLSAHIVSTGKTEEEDMGHAVKNVRYFEGSHCIVCGKDVETHSPEELDECLGQLKKTKSESFGLRNEEGARQWTTPQILDKIHSDQRQYESLKEWAEGKGDLLLTQLYDEKLADLYQREMDLTTQDEGKSVEEEASRMTRDYYDSLLDAIEDAQIAKDFKLKDTYGKQSYLDRRNPEYREEALTDDQWEYCVDCQKAVPESKIPQHMYQYHNILPDDSAAREALIEKRKTYDPDILQQLREEIDCPFCSAPFSSDAELRQHVPAQHQKDLQSVYYMHNEEEIHRPRSPEPLRRRYHVVRRPG